MTMISEHTLELFAEDVRFIKNMHTAIREDAIRMIDKMLDANGGRIEFKSPFFTEVMDWGTATTCKVCALFLKNDCMMCEVIYDNKPPIYIESYDLLLDNPIETMELCANELKMLSVTSNQ